jgi:hypothetical protein
MSSIVDKTAVISGNANIAEKQRGNVNDIANNNTANPDYSDDSESGKLDDKIVKEFAVNFNESIAATAEEIVPGFGIYYNITGNITGNNNGNNTAAAKFGAAAMLVRNNTGAKI